MIHNLNTKAAEITGNLAAGILYHNIAYWAKKNQANGRNLYEGRHWTYNSNKALSELFPYLSTQQIRTALKKLLEHGLIVSGEFNETAYDRTRWYAVEDTDLSAEYGIEAAKKSGELPFVASNKRSCSEQPINLLPVTNQFVASNQPIPDNKPDINTNNKHSVIFSAENIYKLYPSKCPTKGSSTGKSKKKHLPQIERMLKDYTEEQLIKVMSKYIQDCTKNKIYMKNLGTFLNQLPDPDEDGASNKELAEKYLSGESVSRSEMEELIGSSIYQAQKKYLETSPDDTTFNGFDDWVWDLIKNKYEL